MRVSKSSLDEQDFTNSNFIMMNESCQNFEIASNIGNLSNGQQTSAECWLNFAENAGSTTSNFGSNDQKFDEETSNLYDQTPSESYVTIDYEFLLNFPEHVSKSQSNEQVFDKTASNFESNLLPNSLQYLIPSTSHTKSFCRSEENGVTKTRSYVDLESQKVVVERAFQDVPFADSQFFVGENMPCSSNNVSNHSDHKLSKVNSNSYLSTTVSTTPTTTSSLLTCEDILLNNNHSQQKIYGNPNFSSQSSVIDSAIYLPPDFIGASDYCCQGDSGAVTEQTYVPPDFSGAGYIGDYDTSSSEPVSHLSDIMFNVDRNSLYSVDTIEVETTATAIDEMDPFPFDLPREYEQDGIAHPVLLCENTSNFKNTSNFGEEPYISSFPLRHPSPLSFPEKYVHPGYCGSVGDEKSTSSSSSLSSCSTTNSKNIRKAKFQKTSNVMGPQISMLTSKPALSGSYVESQTLDPSRQVTKVNKQRKSSSLKSTYNKENVAPPPKNILIQDLLNACFDDKNPKKRSKFSSNLNQSKRISDEKVSKNQKRLRQSYGSGFNDIESKFEKTSAKGTVISSYINELCEKSSKSTSEKIRAQIGETTATNKIWHSTPKFEKKRNSSNLFSAVMSLPKVCYESVASSKQLNSTSSTSSSFSKSFDSAPVMSGKSYNEIFKRRKVNILRKDSTSSLVNKTTSGILF